MQTKYYLRVYQPRSDHADWEIPISPTISPTLNYLPILTVHSQPPIFDSNWYGDSRPIHPSSPRKQAPERSETVPINTLPESASRLPHFFPPLFVSPSPSLALFSCRPDGVPWWRRLLQLRISSPRLLLRGKNNSSSVPLSRFSHSFVRCLGFLDRQILRPWSLCRSFGFFSAYQREEMVFFGVRGNDDWVGCPFLDYVLVLES